MYHERSTAFRTSSGAGTRATPSRVACCQTATVTLCPTLHKVSMGGYSTPLASCSSDTVPATSLAAAKIIPSVMVVARDSATPLPSPGNTYMLLDCEATKVWPWYSTGGKGEPAAKSILPLVQLTAFSCVISAFVVGFESGKMSGLAHVEHIASMAARVKTGPAPERPKSACGLTYLTTSSRVPRGGVPSVRMYARFHSLRPLASGRSLVIRPFESQTYMLFRACS
mmetsp:Transcript_15569/g.64604  ORF Transcript_15569/g.64604 Transcript_15569/m.64604 type:complete len:226 (+) Transcript_15569:428-1105(+)